MLAETILLPLLNMRCTPATLRAYVWYPKLINYPQVAATGTAVARVDLFLAPSSSSVGCKQLEVPSSSAGQTSFTGNVNIPVQAAGTYYVYAKCKPSSGSMVMSTYTPVTVTGGTGDCCTAQPACLSCTLGTVGKMQALCLQCKQAPSNDGLGWVVHTELTYQG